MNPPSSFLSVDHPCDQTVRRLRRNLPRTGLRVLQTFDLQDARLSRAECPCPHHGMRRCDCRMVVLLIYGGASEPATLVLHGNGGRTWLSLVNTPVQQADASMRACIERALGLAPSGEGL